MTGVTCSLYNDAARYGIYSSMFQGFGPAGYVKDQYHYDKYLQGSSFLSWFSNEKSINQTYINQYLALTNFIQTQFTQDTIVIPYQSSQFGYYANNSVAIVNYNLLPDYTYNFLGMKTLDSQNKIVRYSLDSAHLDFTQAWFTQYVIPYLMKP
jgi:hypothetical protein